MIPIQNLHLIFKEHNLQFFTGVPDSLLKDFESYILDNVDQKKHIIAANEGNAISIATGYNLATGNIGVVYMQNSGLGNCINPLTSLTDKKIYSIPLLLLIGWRGEPNCQDEPQHIKQGAITIELLDLLGIKNKILPDSEESAKQIISEAVSWMKKKQEPYALLVRKGIFEKYISNTENHSLFQIKREEAIQCILPLIEKEAVIVSTTGKTSRELFEYRSNNNQGHNQDFLTVGSMGHSSSIALGIALFKNKKRIYCFDGDGSLIMHMGALSTIGKISPKNFVHILFNNYSYESVGGQPTSADVINFPNLAKSCGYKSFFSLETSEKLKEKIKFINNLEGPILIEVKIKSGSRRDLGRPTKTPLENKEEFIKFLQERDDSDG